MRVILKTIGAMWGGEKHFEFELGPNEGPSLGKVLGMQKTVQMGGSLKSVTQVIF